MSICSLNRLQKGQEAKIYEINSFSDTTLRLLEMGMTKGTKVKIERYNPFKSALQIAVNGFHLCLSFKDAASFNVCFENPQTV